MAQTIKARRLQKARQKYDRVTAPFLQKTAAIYAVLAIVPVSLATRRWVADKIAQMREDYLRPEQIEIIDQLDERNEKAKQKFETRMANKKARREAKLLERQKAKTVPPAQTPPPPNQDPWSYL
jgi:hypothetical protein